MPKCTKVKNPCKICLSQVTTKNGLQCHGACKTWMHFDCLNYTPGKIRDIKAGTITVMCPCPDCKSLMPREIRKDELYSCNNSYCPANQLPKCDNQACPVNLNCPRLQSNTDRGCALDRCGNKCKKNSVPHLPDCPQPPPLPPCKQPHSFPLHSSGCMSSTEISGDYGRCASPDISLNTLEQMCNTVGQLTNQLNGLMSKMMKTSRSPGCGKLNCSPRGTKQNCPKPCFCPGNPGR